MRIFERILSSVKHFFFDAIKLKNFNKQILKKNVNYITDREKIQLYFRILGFIFIWSLTDKYIIYIYTLPKRIIGLNVVKNIS